MSIPLGHRRGSAKGCYLAVIGQVPAVTRQHTSVFLGQLCDHYAGWECQDPLGVTICRAIFSTRL